VIPAARAPDQLAANVAWVSYVPCVALMMANPTPEPAIAGQSTLP
jgi:hypothetical protein